MSLTLVTGPSVEPVTLEDAKTHLRVSGTSEDGYIASLISAARSQVETYTRRSLLTQTWRLTLDGFPASGLIELPYPPVASVTNVKYVDEDGVTQTVSSSDYRLDGDAAPGRLEPAYGTTWPTPRDVVGAVTVTYVTGWTKSSEVPAALLQAMLLLVGGWYEGRESVVVGAGVREIPFGVRSLLSPWRVHQG